MFGTALGLSQRNLHDIKERGSHRNLSLCFKEALESWLNIKVEHTWDHVCVAVKDCDNNALANRLRKKHRSHLEGDFLDSCRTGYSL